MFRCDASTVSSDKAMLAVNIPIANALRTFLDHLESINFPAVVNQMPPERPHGKPKGSNLLDNLAFSSEWYSLAFHDLTLQPFGIKVMGSYVTICQE